MNGKEQKLRQYGDDWMDSYRQYWQLVAASKEPELSKELWVGSA
jgi:hypothetical protein